MNQWFLLVKLMSTLRKFYGRHHGLINRYCYWIQLLVKLSSFSPPPPPPPPPPSGMGNGNRFWIYPVYALWFSCSQRF